VDGDAKTRGVWLRTHVAILDAARTVFPENPAASLGDIAIAANVGRSTLHRHFHDRDELIRALGLYVYELSNAAIKEAHPESGSPIEALRRLIDGQFDLAAILHFINNERIIERHRDDFAALNRGDALVRVTLQRAAKVAAGPELDWCERVFWELLRMGADMMVRKGLPRHEAVDKALDTLCHGIVRADTV
jgi:TetR/AcrR family transcriptional repressor of lfrA